MRFELRIWVIGRGGALSFSTIKMQMFAPVNEFLHIEFIIRALITAENQREEDRIQMILQSVDNLSTHAGPF